MWPRAWKPNRYKVHQTHLVDPDSDEAVSGTEAWAVWDAELGHYSSATTNYAAAVAVAAALNKENDLPTKVMTMRLSVFRDGSDCTAGGMTRLGGPDRVQGFWGADTFEINLEAARAYFEKTGEPAMALDPREIAGRAAPRFVPVYATEDEQNMWHMFGGNFVWACDSRFRDRVCEYPVPVHDRVERGNY